MFTAAPRKTELVIVFVPDMFCIRRFASLFVAMSSEFDTKMLFASVRALTPEASTPFPALLCTFISDSDGLAVFVSEIASPLVF